jgi:competence protein ComEC
MKMRPVCFADIIILMLIQKSQIFAGLLILYLLATALFSNFQFPSDNLFVFVVILGIAIFSLWRFKSLRYALLILFVITFAGWRVNQVTPKNDPSWINYNLGKEVIIEGRVVEVPKNSGKAQQVIIKIDGIKGNVLLTTALFPEYKFGDTLLVDGKLTDLRAESEQYRGYFKAQQIYGFLGFPKVITKDVKYPFQKDWYFRLRKPLLLVRLNYERVIARILSEPQSGLLSGILLGSKANLSQDLLLWLQLTGTIHIIALSGYNITVLVEMLRILTKRLPRNLAFNIPVIGIILFVLATGLSSSVIRAAVMGSMLLLAKRVGRQSDGLIAVLFASAIMVAFSPNILIYDVGFQLSFSAVCGIIFLAPKLEKYFSIFGGTMSQILSATLSAQIFTWPITSLYFGVISIIAPLANILILPFIPILMLFGFIIASMGFVSIWLAQNLSIILWVILSYFIKTVKLLAEMPVSSKNIKIDSVIFVAAYYILLGEIVMILSRQGRRYGKEKIT